MQRSFPATIDSIPQCTDSSEASDPDMYAMCNLALDKAIHACIYSQLGQVRRGVM